MIQKIDDMINSFESINKTYIFCKWKIHFLFLPSVDIFGKQFQFFIKYFVEEKKKEK